MHILHYPHNRKQINFLIYWSINRYWYPFHSSLISRLRMRRRDLVAESALSNRSPGDAQLSLVGEAGADLAIGCRSISVVEEGNSSETVLLGLNGNFGIGRELGGGEFE